MKASIKLGLLLFLASSVTFAVNPVSGIYAGLMLGGSYTPDTNFTFVHPVTGRIETGRLVRNALIDVAAAIGYRCAHLRFEGELLFNDNPYGALQLNGFTFHKAGKFNTTYAMKGQTGTLAFMANAFYDLYTPGDISYFFPYVGLGIGYASVKNQIKFYNNNLYIDGTNLTQTSSTPAAQGIVGIGYFLDDFAYFGLDYRYFSTKSIQPFNSRMQVSSINLSFTSAFDWG